MGQCPVHCPIAQNRIPDSYGLVHVWGNVLCIAPSRRTVFLILTELLGVLAFLIHGKPDSGGKDNAEGEVKRVNTWKG